VRSSKLLHGISDLERTSNIHGHQDDSRYFPYKPPATHARAHQLNMIDSVDASLGKRERQDRDTGHESTVLGRSSAYPSGTTKVVTIGEHTCYLDRNDKVIGHEGPRRDSEPPRRAPSLDAVTDGVKQFELETPSVKKRLPIIHKPCLDTLPKDKKLNSTLIKADTTIQDDLLDKRKMSTSLQ
jgi:hypothetical protein